ACGNPFVLWSHKDPSVGHEWGQVSGGGGCVDTGASNTTADGDAPGIRPDLSIGSGDRCEEADAECWDEGQMPLHGGACHFGFGAQSELVVVPAVMVEPVTSRPMAMPPQSAWTPGGA